MIVFYLFLLSILSNVAWWRCVVARWIRSWFEYRSGHLNQCVIPANREFTHGYSRSTQPSLRGSAKMRSNSVLRQQLTRSLGSLAPSHRTCCISWCPAEAYSNWRSPPNPMGSEEPKGRCHWCLNVPETAILSGFPPETATDQRPVWPTHGSNNAVRRQHSSCVV